MAKVAVLGAGFVGLSAAYWLMRDGHQVTVYDPAGVAGGASYGNAGTFANYACIPVNNPSVFRDLPRFLLSSNSPFRLRWRYLPHLAPWLTRFLLSSTERRYVASAAALSVLLSRAHDGYREMIEQARLEQFIRRSECLYLYSGAAAFRASEPTLTLRRSLGVDFSIVSREQVQQMEPQLSPLFDRGVLFAGSWFLSDPEAFLKALASWLRQSGLHMEVRAVSTIKPQSNGVLLETAAGSAAYDYVAVCAGAHSRSFARQCGDRIPLDTERGYHIMYPGSSNLISRPVGWAERGFYMTPMEKGIRVAGTVELAGLNPHKHQGLLDLLQFSSRRALPALTTPTESWLGFRPSLPDGLPVMGRSRASERVIYAFGHQHIGLTLGGLSGAVVADLVAGRASPFNLAPYAADRFY
ncbi:FAD-binding oxidoreductase [Collimonas sp.]|jgi:glycine/D-amino acid oxidase-like deaminating enzyme|uniref:NAD(P)/FAD-dependent oxidoreductase n=1 Tax=Collimonas sp. TaxID=1963772 RepID=UPI002D17B73C|nr:FAD-binding oxidoreductase [Collimonas sp.]HWW06298.1 FAD-binding oxidoreductase [Collimonas sp.]